MNSQHFIVCDIQFISIHFEIVTSSQHANALRGYLLNDDSILRLLLAYLPGGLNCNWYRQYMWFVDCELVASAMCFCLFQRVQYSIIYKVFMNQKVEFLK